jgi:prevent-host-death family protein
MKTVNMHEAKTHLSRLVDEAANGQPFVIAKAGRPVVTVSAVSAPVKKSRIGCLPDIDVPADFDTMGSEEIESLFGLA